MEILMILGALLTAAEAPPAAGMGTLSGTIVDAATGQPAACTVKIVDSAGKTVIERESFTAGFRCGGRFKKQLPAGRARIQVSRGPETRMVEKEVEVPADGDVGVEIRLERNVDLRKRGWFAGDNHVHMLHGERTVPVTFDDVALAARAEDLSFLSLAQDWAIDDPTPEKLTAELGSRSTADCRLAWNMEAPKNYYRGDATRCLGHCWNIATGGRTQGGDDVVRALSAASAHDYQSEKPTYANFESHRLIHAQNGAVFYTHPARWWTGPWGGQGIYPKRDGVRVSNMAVELPLDTLVGPTFDGVDVLTTAGELEAGELAFQLWCLLLNHGYRVAATASSDACFDRPGGAVPGSVRTYVFLDGPFSLPAAARAMAAGRTFATSGPILLASLAGKPPGSVIETSAAARKLSVEAWASGTDARGLTRLELFRDGKLLEARDLAPPVPKLEASFDIDGSKDAWYCLRLYGGERRQRATSGAFFLDRSPHKNPAPVPARVEIELRDADSGAPVSGTITELAYHATMAERGATHPVGGGDARLEVPGTVRLEASAPGYRPLTLSPFLDHPPLLEAITHLKAEDLVDWGTFEKIRALLGEVRMTFRLKKVD